MSVASGGIYFAPSQLGKLPPPATSTSVNNCYVSCGKRYPPFVIHLFNNAMRPDTVNFRFHPSTEQALKDARTTFNSQKILLWRAVLKSCVFGGRFHRVRMDAGPIWRRKNILSFSNENGYNWTSPTRPMISTKNNIEPQHEHEIFTTTSNWFWIELWNWDIKK